MAQWKKAGHSTVKVMEAYLPLPFLRSLLGDLVGLLGLLLRSV